MNILGFNPSHHGSVCLLKDGELKFFIQEERITKRKHTPYPFRSFLNLLEEYRIDNISWGAPSAEYTLSHLDYRSYWGFISNTYNNKSTTTNLSTHHHYCHAAHSFYNSGFKTSLSLIIDGMGSNILGNTFNKEEPIGQETETMFECSYPSNFRVLQRNIYNYKRKNINLAQVYETITKYLGWSINESGKTMGLSPYGNQNSQIPPFFIGNTGNPKVFYRILDIKKESKNKHNIIIDEKTNPQLKLPINPKEWHYDESKITNLEMDLAWKVQNDTQQLVGDYIEEAIQKTNIKQICCAGGYFLNCVTNYYLIKRFPDVEFYFEPIANDAGTAIGAAKLSWHSQTKDKTIRPFKSLYLGKQYSKEELLKGIKKYVDTPQ